MLKQNKGKLLVTSLIILFPILIGLVLWPRLPDQIATHFGTDGTADGWSSKPFAVFSLPLILLAAHIFCIVITSADPKQKNIGKKPIALLFWIMPVVSLVMNICLYAYAMEIPISMSFIIIALIGIMEIVLGNIMPKVQQNYTFGIKLPWTLNDPENWNHTHRVAGWTQVIAGMLMIVSALWKNIWVIVGITLFSVLIPILYSYTYYTRHKQDE